MNQTLTAGRIVHFRLETGQRRGDYRPALVIRVIGGDVGALAVFADPMNDGLAGPHFIPSALRGEDEGEWLWPEELPARVTSVSAGGLLPQARPGAGTQENP